jgi:methylisocitrate lyase
MPNPWDVGSARLLEQLGCAAVATTSSGFAWTRGRRDNQMTLDETLAHFAALASSVSIPVNGDFEGAFAVAPADAAANVIRAVATGIAGVSIEDSTGVSERPLLDFTLAVERVRAARAALDAAASRVVLTARSEGFIVGRPDLAETIRRLTAFADAGADCLYAPGIRSRDDIAAVVEAVRPKPVNVLVGTNFTTVQELRDLGVRRISVGGALARTAWASVVHTARGILDRGDFGGLAGAMPTSDLEPLVSPAR